MERSVRAQRRRIRSPEKRQLNEGRRVGQIVSRSFTLFLPPPPQEIRSQTSLTRLPRSG